MIIAVNFHQVETDWVGVHWQCKAYSKDGAWSDQAQPKFAVEGENLKKLKLLNVFEPSTLQVGDRNFYVINGNENVITREQWRKQQREIYQVPKHSPRKARGNAQATQDTRKSSIDEKKQEEKSSESSVVDNNKQLDGSVQGNERNVQNASNNVLTLPIQGTDSSEDWETEDGESQSDSASVRDTLRF